MSTQVTLKAEERDVRGKGWARKLRASGRVPAVVYGKGEETVSLSVDAKEVEHLFASISIENTIVDLKVPGEKKAFPTLVREVQVHPFRPVLLHIDFYRIRMGERLEVEIPVNLNGVPIGVRESGGILQQIIHELLVKVLPSQIPESIEVDVTGLELGDAIHVSDLELAEDVEIMIEMDRTLAAVVAPKVVEEEEEEAEDEELEGELEGEGEAPEGEAESDGGDEGSEEGEG